VRIARCISETYLQGGRLSGAAHALALARTAQLRLWDASKQARARCVMRAASSVSEHNLTLLASLLRADLPPVRRHRQGAQQHPTHAHVSALDADALLLTLLLRV
jgi:hypothetical protein